MIFKYLINYILHLVVQISEGSKLNESLVPTFKLSFTLAPLWYIWNKIVDWTLDNQDYMYFVLGAIFIDWIFGTVKHAFIDRDFDWKDNAIGLVTKIGLAVAGGFLFEGVNHLVGSDNILADTLRIVTRLVVFLYPAISAWKNMHIVSGGKFPPKIWITKTGKFYNTLNTNELKNKENE